jgi:phosphatidylglycerol:prolipoprotein diacylglycerol transferase
MEAIDPQVRWLASMLVYVLAYAVAAAAFWIAARRRGMATHGVYIVAQAGLVGGIIGANVAQILATGAPGKAIEGGLVGGWLAVIVAKQWIGLRRPTGDLFAFALSAGEMIGRIGCFIGGCCFGKSAAIAWGVYDHGMLRHPTQLYLSAGAGITLGLLVWLERRGKLPENGIFYVQGLCFCAVRFSVDFFRDVSAPYAGLTLVQLACIAGFALFVFNLAPMLSRPKLRHEFA